MYEILHVHYYVAVEHGFINYDHTGYLLLAESNLGRFLYIFAIEIQVNHKSPLSGRKELSDRAENFFETVLYQMATYRKVWYKSVKVMPKWYTLIYIICGHNSKHMTLKEITLTPPP